MSTSNRMVIYYSGEGSKSNPEITLQDKANLMLTFHDMYSRGCKPTKRFQEVIRSRKKRRKKHDAA